MSLPLNAKNFLRSLIREGRDKAAYSFHFVAARHGGDLRLIQGMVRTDALPASIDVEPFEAESVVAAAFRLGDLSLDMEGFIIRLLGAGVKTPIGNVQLPKPEGGSHAVVYNPEDARGGQLRWHTLVIRGEGPAISLQSTEWDLRAGGKPFADFRDFMDTFGVGPQQEVVGLCEIVAENVVAIAGESRVSAGKARVAMLCSEAIDLENVSASFMVYHGNRVSDRFEIEGRHFSWDRQTGFMIGRIEFDVPTPSTLCSHVRCVLCECGAALLLDRRSAPHSQRPTISFSCSGRESFICFECHWQRCSAARQS